LKQWQDEGVDCSLVDRMANSVPGMYMVNVADDGERSFLYWRKNSPASRMFDDQDRAVQHFAKIADYDYLYLSGISLAILGSESRERVMRLLERYRQNGGKIIFDGNYRPKLWSNAEQAQNAYIQMYKLTDIALPTVDDEIELFGYSSAERVMQAVQDCGVTEIVVKMGGEGCLALSDGVVTNVAAEAVEPLDTTAAGDSFNAGYIASRLSGASNVDACSAGHHLFDYSSKFGAGHEQIEIGSINQSRTRAKPLV